MFTRKKKQVPEDSPTLPEPQEPQSSQDSHDSQSSHESQPSQSSQSSQSSQDSQPSQDSQDPQPQPDPVAALLEDADLDETMRPKVEASLELALRALAGDGDKGALGDLVDILVKGHGYEEAVKEAFDRGEIRGRNARIDELTEIAASSDGVPHPGAAGTASPRRTPSIFSLAREAY